MKDENKMTLKQEKIFNYIKKNKKSVKDYSLRQLAAELNVSPASVVRTIQKMGYKHYYELGNQLEKEIHDPIEYDDTTLLAKSFLENLDNIEMYDQKIQAFKKLTAFSKTFLFYGAGTSSYLASYGTRQFVNNGFDAFSIDDPFYPAQLNKNPNSERTFIVLSVSGETEQTLDITANFKDKGAKIVSITNKKENSVAGMSDLNFSYEVKSRVIGQTINLTSQIPVIYILERLARELRP